MIQIESNPALTEQIAEADKRFISYRTTLGLLRFLTKNPDMVPHLATSMARQASEALRTDPPLHYRMQLAALHSVLPDAFLGQYAWSDLDTFVALFASVAKKTDRCLELGVGGGRLTVHIAPLVGSLVAQDVSAHNFNEVRRVLANFGNVTYLADASPGDKLPSKAFEIVAATDVVTLLELDELIQYSRNVLRFLTSEGYFVVSLKTIDDDEEIERYLGLRESNFSQTLFRLPSQLYIRLFERAGFVVARTVRSSVEEEGGPQNGRHLNLLLQKPRD